VDKDTGSVFVANINLQTGEIINDDLPSIPVDKKMVERYVDNLRKQIKEFRIDEILAEKGIDINDVIDDLENVSTVDEFDEIAGELIKNMC
jgi:pyoverdine/dityrosine biosynthesis protein Dit1